MNHPDEERLHDLVDDLLPGEEATEISRHLRSCASCRAFVTGNRSLRAAAAGLAREVEPGPELWPGIEARIRSRAGSGVAMAPSPRTGDRTPARGDRRTPLSRAGLLRAAAVILLLGTTSFGAIVLSRWDRSPSGQTADALQDPGSVGLDDDPSIALHVAGTLAEAYGPTLRELEALLESRRDRLQPETVRLIEENLQVIDEAIHEVGVALANDPGSREGARTLAGMYEAKVRLLWQAVGLTREI